MSKILEHKAHGHSCAHNRRETGRIRLPVAPKAQARVKCAPELPTPRALTPEQAMNWLDYLEDLGQKIKVVNLTGPGDPLATPDLSLQTMQMVREKYPQTSLCLASLGFGATELAPKLADLGLAHVSLLMDAADAKAAEALYAWIRPGTRTLPLGQAASTLVEEQAAAIKALKEAGVPVHIRTTVYPGVNSEQIQGIAKKAAELGADEMKLFPFLAGGEGCATTCTAAEIEELEALAAQAAEYLPARFMHPDVCAAVTEYDFSDAANLMTLPKPTAKRPYLAVCSTDGFEVDLHLGMADQYLIYGPKDGPVLLLESRPAPEPGGGESRWRQTGLILSDCFAVLAAAAGESPKRILGDSGLVVLTQEDNLEGLVDTLFGGGKKKGKKK